MRPVIPTERAHRTHEATPSTAGSLRPRQAAALVAWGILLWFVVAVFLRCAPHAIFDRGVRTALLFAAAVPIAAGTIWATRRVAALRPDQVVAGAALASAAAMACDAVAFTWTSLYGSGPDLVPAAALILWGVAAIILGAFLSARRAGA